jgi:hypothetical protein
MFAGVGELLRYGVDEIVPLHQPFSIWPTATLSHLDERIRMANQTFDVWEQYWEGYYGWCRGLAYRAGVDFTSRPSRNLKGGFLKRVSYVASSLFGLY